MNLIETVNAYGGHFVQFAWPMLAQSTVLIVLLLGLDWLLRKKVRAVMRYGLLSLVLVKLVLPPSLALPSGLGYWLSPAAKPAEASPASTRAPAPVVPTVPTPAVVWAAPEGIEAPLPQATAEPTGMPERVLLAGAGSKARPAVLSWQGGCLALWVAGVFALGICVIRRSREVSRLTGTSQNAPAELQQILGACRGQLGVRRHITLKLVASSGSPAVCGFFKPAIVVPGFLAMTLSEAQLRLVLLHALGHVKRGDLWMNHVQTFLQIVYWYNPLLWVWPCSSGLLGMWFWDAGISTLPEIRKLTCLECTGLEPSYLCLDSELSQMALTVVSSRLVIWSHCARFQMRNPCPTSR